LKEYKTKLYFTIKVPVIEIDNDFNHRNFDRVSETFKVQNSEDISIFGKLSVRQTVRSAKCPFGKMSVRQNVRSAKRPSAKCPFGKMSVRQNVRRQNVRSAKCLSAKCLSAKCLSVKSPATVNL
jgi:hypothetical protein